MFYVYILFSQKISKFYCGQTSNLSARLETHNTIGSASNKHGMPWELIGYLLVKTRSDAMTLERKIKKRGIGRWLKENSDNLEKSTG